VDGLKRRFQGFRGNAENAERHAEMLEEIGEEVPHGRVVGVASIETQVERLLSKPGLGSARVPHLI
jgi:hypothetical protein